jgi:hypothetical protein
MRKKIKQDYYGLVYLYKNKETGACYVGQAQDFERRKKDHLTNARHKNRIGKNNNQGGSLLHIALQQVGEEGFDISVLKKCYSRQELNDWETFYIMEYNCIGENGYNKICRGHYEIHNSEEAKKHFAKKSQGKKNPLAKAKYFCVYPAKNGSFVLRMRIKRKHSSKTFKTEEEAGEMYDCVCLRLYGADCTLNFPEKRQEYLERDLESIYNFYISKPVKTAKYLWICQEKNGRWKPTGALKNKKKRLHLASFSSQEDAAKMADKMMFFFNDVPIEDLNFPELAKDYNKDELEKFFEKYYHCCPNRWKQSSVRATSLNRVTWVSKIPYKGLSAGITKKHKTSREAQLALIDYLSELLKETPNLENLTHLILFPRGIEILENKKEQEESFLIKMEKLRQHLLDGLQ